MWRHHEALFENKRQYIKYIVDLSNDLKRLEEMSINAFESSQKYSYKVFASKVLEVYKKAIKNKKKKKSFFKKLFGKKEDNNE